MIRGRRALFRLAKLAWLCGAACSAKTSAEQSAAKAPASEHRVSPAPSNGQGKAQSPSRTASTPAPAASAGPRVLRHGGDGKLSLAPSWSVKSEGADRVETCTDPSVVAIDGVPNLKSIAAEDLKTARGRISFSDGRQRTQVGLPLDVLVTQASGDTIEVTPCEGAPIHWTVAEVRHRAGQFVVIPTSHGALKVVERRPPGSRVVAGFPTGVDVVTRARHIHAIRVFHTVAARDRRRT